MTEPPTTPRRTARPALARPSVLVLSTTTVLGRGHSSFGRFSSLRRNDRRSRGGRISIVLTDTCSCRGRQLASVCRTPRRSSGSTCRQSRAARSVIDGEASCITPLSLFPLRRGQVPLRPELVAGKAVRAGNANLSIRFDDRAPGRIGRVAPVRRRPVAPDALLHVAHHQSLL
jgi:hypothetical protein